MLSNLSIRNYALIRELEMSPSSSLNIITGETGAGKSIMLGAIGLLLGKRADTKILLSKETKCVIEGTFEIGKYNLAKEFGEADIDYEESTIIRREINPNGKSRAFINDIPTTLDVLKTIGLKLLDIHSQNESIEIAKKETRLKVVDAYAQNLIQQEAFKKAYANFKLAEINLNELTTKQADLNKEDSYNTFLLNELLDASLKSNEVEGLENELKILENSESIKLKLSQVAIEFQDSDYSVSDKLSDIGQSLGTTASFTDQLSILNERFSSSLVELRDIIVEVKSLSENMEYDPEKIVQINDRLSLIYQLQQKHQVNDATELITIQNNLESKIQFNENLEERIVEAKKLFEITQKQIQKTGKVLSSSREIVLKKFSQDINALLKEVGIPNGTVKMVHTIKEPSTSGFDTIEILFSANEGIAPEAVSKVASGGEFSRLMLCIKSLLADKSSLPTIIFDEIDTGVSGEVARKMGQMLKRMSQNHQLIAISHLPQIAAKGNAHYFVYKNEANGNTESSIRKLNDQESLEEIAKMIGGNNPTNAALENAKELIKF
jgi:DNA repair protein RecN (Recombination protein N)